MTTIEATPIGLRDYQTAMVDAVLAASPQHPRQYAVLPTGCGKTRAGAAILAHFHAAGRRSLWIVHTRELVHQAAEVIAGLIPTASVGIVMATSDETDADIVVASVQTLRSQNRSAAVLNGRSPLDGVCIVDECHHVTSKNSYAGIIEDLSIPVVGITATPFRADSEEMQSVLPHCAYERSIMDMIDGGWLCNLNYRPVPITDLDLTDAKLVRKLGDRDFADSYLAPKVQSAQVVNELIAGTAQTIKDRGAPALVFATNVAHAQQLAAAYARAGISSGVVYGDQDRAVREQTLDDWRERRIQLVTNVAVLTEGFDFPDIGTLIIARPTTSVALYTQMVGRGTRIAQGKNECMILDMTGRMPARYRTISLDDMIGEEASETDANGDVILRRQVRNPNAPKRIRMRALKDPYGRSRFAWTQHPVIDSVWFAPIGKDVRAVLVPHGDSGLFVPHVFMDRDVTIAAGDPVPRRQAIADMEATLAKSHIRVKALSTATSSWRSEMPSDKQLGLLFRMSSVLGTQAKGGGWTKGEVSLAIDALMITSTLRKIIAQDAHR